MYIHKNQQAKTLRMLSWPGPRKCPLHSGSTLSGRTMTARGFCIPNGQWPELWRHGAVQVDCQRWSWPFYAGHHPPRRSSPGLRVPNKGILRAPALWGLLHPFCKWCAWYMSLSYRRRKATEKYVARRKGGERRRRRRRRRFRDTMYNTYCTLRRPPGQG